MQKYYYQRLRDIREDREKTQKEIAEVLNTTYQYYSAYERGVLQHLRRLPFGAYGRAEKNQMTAARAVIFLRMPIEKIRLIFAHRNSIIRYYSFNITPFGVKVNSIV